MGNRSLWWLVVAIGACGASGAAHAEAGGSTAAPGGRTDALSDVARELYEQGLAAYQKGDFEKAYAAFLGAWRLKNHWQIAVNLGASAMHLGKPREAAEHLRYYLREAPASDDSATRREAEQTLAKAKEKIGTVEIDVSEPGAEVKVDGVIAGTSPLAHAIFVDPGAHRVTAQKGNAIAAETVALEAGKTRMVVLKLEPVAAPAVSPWKGIVISGAALSLVATGVGAGLVVGGADKGNAALKVSDDIYNAGQSCVTGAANHDARCQNVKSESSAADTMNRAGIGLLIGGGALAAGTLVYWLVAPRSAAMESAIFIPMVSSTGAGAVVQGSF